MDKKIIIIIVAIIAIAAGAYFFMQKNDEPSFANMKNAAQNAVEDAKDLADK